MKSLFLFTTFFEINVYINYFVQTSRKKIETLKRLLEFEGTPLNSSGTKKNLRKLVEPHRTTVKLSKFQQNLENFRPFFIFLGKLIKLQRCSVIKQAHLN